MPLENWDPEGPAWDEPELDELEARDLENEPASVMRTAVLHPFSSKAHHLEPSLKNRRYKTPILVHSP